MTQRASGTAEMTCRKENIALRSYLDDLRASSHVITAAELAGPRPE